MRKLLIITLSLLFFLSIKTKVSAYILEKEYVRKYEVKDDYVDIKESKTFKITQNSYYIPNGSQEGFTIFNPVENDPSAKDKLQKTMDSIIITDTNGKTLSFKTENTTGTNLILRITLATGLYYNQPYGINLSYKSYGLLTKSGALRDVYVPSFSKDYTFEDAQSKERITTEIKIPTLLGRINFTVPKVNVVKEDKFWTINYTQDQLVGQTGWIEIGTTQYYAFQITQKYNNSTNIPVAYNTYKLVLPGDIDRGPIKQKVFFSKIIPTPSSIETDENGNLFASFKIPAVDNGSIEIDGYAQLDDNNIDISNSGNIANIPENIIALNTKSSAYWESDNLEIVKAAKAIAGSNFQNPNASVYDLISKTYKYVVDKINYSEVKRFGLNKRQGALATLEGGAAVCMEYSDLFIALMRAEGIPARAAFGTGYSALDYNTSGENAINHQWAEVYIPNINSWIGVDTTWGKNGPALIGGDLNHFYSHVASKDPETPSTAEITYYGKDYQYYDRNMKVQAISSIPEGSFQLSNDLIKQYPISSDNKDLIKIIMLFLSKTNDNFDKQFTDRGITILVAEFLKIIIFPLLLLLIIYKLYKNKTHKLIKTY